MSDAGWCSHFAGVPDVIFRHGQWSGVKLAVRSHRLPVLIAGATGPNAAYINGVFDPSSFHVGSYVTRCDVDTRLAYQAGRWWVSSEHAPAPCPGPFRFIDHPVLRSCTAPLTVGPVEASAWEVWVPGPGGGAWVSTALTVVPFPAAVQIFGAAEDVCGLYYPCRTARNAAPAFEKQFQPRRFLWRTALRGWVVTSAEVFEQAAEDPEGTLLCAHPSAAMPTDCPRETWVQSPVPATATRGTWRPATAAAPVVVGC